MIKYRHFDEIVNGNGDDGRLLNRRSLNLDFTNANSIGLLVQQQQINGQQLLSPTMLQRRDSILRCSFSTTPMPSISQHQAGAQPYRIAQITPHTSNASSQRPVNMSRSASLHSSNSASHYHDNDHQHRTPRGSFGNASTPVEPHRSRSPSQYSVTSTIQQAEPKYFADRLHLNSPHYRPIQQSNLQPTPLLTDSRYELGPTHAAEMFHFDINDIISGAVVGDEDHTGIHSQATTSNG